MAQDDGWFSYIGSGDNSHLTHEQGQIVEERNLLDPAHAMTLCMMHIEPTVTPAFEAAIGNATWR
jgi:hypothetical protein